jgi:hypothetical protein
MESDPLNVSWEVASLAPPHLSSSSFQSQTQTPPLFDHSAQVYHFATANPQLMRFSRNQALPSVQANRHW